jgi:hypothetical protein
MTSLYLLKWLCLLALGSEVLGTVSFHAPSWALAPFRGNGGGRNTCLGAKKAAGTPPARGFGAAKSKTIKQKKPSKQQVMKQLEKKYGGTSAEEIAQATQKLSEHQMQQLPAHIQMALELQGQLQKWESRLANMPLLDQANIPAAEMEGAHRARHELERILKEHGLSHVDLRNTLQKITWDALADAKAARSLIGQMSADIAQRVDTACTMAAEAVTNPRTVALISAVVLEYSSLI